MADVNCTSYGPDDSPMGAAGVDYLQFYCQAGEGAWPLLVLVLWICFLIYVLCDTADSWFSPTLAAISDKLGIAPDVAGVTFLAFGNGAPDVFSSIAAMSSRGGQSALVGVGALLGAGMFISTVVVGGILAQNTKGGENGGSSGFSAMIEVPPAAFSRDITFFVAALMLLLVVASSGSVGIPGALSFLGLYVAYVIFVFRLSGRRGGTQNSQNASEEAIRGNMELLDAGGIAFWHPEAFSDNNNAENSSEFLENDESSVASDSGYSDVADSPQPSAAAAAGGGVGVGGSSSGLDEQGLPRAGASSFTHHLIDDHFAWEGEETAIPPDVASLMSGSTLGVVLGDAKRAANNSNYAHRNAAAAAAAAGGGSLSMAQPLLLKPPAVSGAGNGQAAEAGSGQRRRQRRRRWCFERRHAAWTTLYWRQWRIRRQLHRQLNDSAFWEKSYLRRLLHLVELPLILARNATIPPFESDSWSQPYAIVSVALVPLFLAVVSNAMKKRVFGVVPVYAVLPLVSAGLAVGVALTTHASRPPKSLAASLALVLMAFASCICWVYVIAGEVVAVLETIGVVTRFPASVLGLTVLAWGNSSGDLVTNMAVSRAGFPGMAIAGCYGGPLFNLLVGLGAPLLFLAAKAGPGNEVAFELDAASTVTAVFVVLAMAATLLAVAAHGFVYPTWSVPMLFGLYGAYLLAQVIVLLV